MLSMDAFDVEIKIEFINESLMNLEEAEGSFMELESASDTKPLLDKIFRLAHNLKGGSRAVGFGDVAEFTHQLENLVLKIQKGEVALSPQLITTLLRSNDRLVEMLSELKSNIEAHFDNADILKEIQDWVDGRTVETQESVAETLSSSESVSAEDSVPNATNFFAEENKSPEPEVEYEPNTELLAELQAKESDFTEPSPDLVENTELLAELQAQLGGESSDEANTEINASNNVVSETEAHLEASQQTPVATVVAAAVPQEIVAAKNDKVEKADKNAKGDKGDKNDKGGKEDEVIRVNLSRIDLLNDYVGELIVLQSVIQQQSTNIMNSKLSASMQQMVKLSKDIQGLSMSLRMLPVKPMVQKLQRVVRDTANALDKDVRLDVIGEQMDIDKSVLDRLADPLIHILRNAVDHGLETTQDRLSAGKDKQGRVLLSFSNEGNHLVVEVRDDGKGINSEIVYKKAIEKKLITANQSMTEKQIIHLIFHPGFSTKAVTSEISGRGVGMDVVKTNVEKIGGQVDVTTTLGKGSVFKMQIPLTLAVIEGLVVTSENNRYVVPLSQVQETVNLKSQKIHQGKLGIGSCFELRGIVVPMFDLDEVLGGKKSAPKEDGTGLIVNVGDYPMALVVRDIVRAQQVVIKPLGNGIHSQKGWIGSCVLGDGLPTLIISPVDLLNGKITQGLDKEMTRRAA